MFLNRQLVKAALLGISVLVSSPMVSADVVSAPASKAPANFADVVAPLLPAVVNISTTKEIKRDARLEGLPALPPGHPLEDLFRQFDRGSQMPQTPRKTTSLGSGFIHSQEGDKAFVVTCNHVIEGADEIKVILNDDTELVAELIGRDRRTDLALLVVKTKKQLATASFGDSSKARVGEWVIAIGNPFGLSSTVTIGVISTIARDISGRGGALGGADYVNGYIQTDAPINMGNSGGPMFDVYGNVLAISTAIFSPTGGNIGIGFGIPANLAKTVVAQLKEFGRTRRGWIGVLIQNVDEQVAESLGLPQKGGAIVAEVTKKGPGEAAGLRRDDVILSFNGTEIKESKQLPHVVGETKIGQTVPMVIWRDGKKVSLNITVGEFEKAEEQGLIQTDMQKKPEASEAAKVEPLTGITVVELTPQVREQNRIRDGIEGALVTDVDPNSEAYQKGIRPGDIISSLGVGANKVSIQKPQQLKDYISKVKKAGKRNILLSVLKDDRLLFVALSLKDAADEHKAEK